jgi:hypothetical protein
LELVINPDDYGQTVENIFYASFLIKEGSAGIQVDDDGLVVIRTFSSTLHCSGQKLKYRQRE